MTRPHHW